MCGFAGIWTKTSSGIINKNNLALMGSKIINRGPDDEGTWINEQSTLGLVHRRLAIVDLSAAGHQPMLSASKRWVIAFNGEIYNHLAIRKEIEQEKVVQWQGHSDTETLLAAIECFGLDETLKKSVGMFTFALWDNKEEVLYLARDRMGEKPLYYGKIDDQVLFGSELTCIEVLLLKNKLTINKNALSQLIRQGFVMAPASIYNEVNKLEPGKYIKFDNEKSTIHTYWSVNNILRDNKTLDLSAEEAVTKLESLIKGSLKDQMLADVPLGAFLSGGVDSSAIVALMQNLSDKPIKTYSIGFDNEKYNEAGYAAEVAKHLGTDHTELYVNEKDILDAVNVVTDVFTEPFGDSSQLPMYLVCKMAKKHVTVCLSGDGGDELFWGYSRYQATLKAWSKLTGLPKFTKETLKVIAKILPIRILNQLGNLTVNQNLLGDKLAKALELLDVNEFISFYRNFLMASYRDVDKLVIGGGDGLASIMLEHNVIKDLSKQDAMTAIDMVSYLPDDILCKVDRAAMGVSLEGRIPLLDHRIVEFALKLPHVIKYCNEQAKYPLRQVLYKYVPKHLIERPKKGFSVPLGDWLKNELKCWAENLLTYEKLAADGYLNPEQVMKLWNEHLSGKRNWAAVLWNILMFQAWLEKRR
ncbi:asparagine synthase (glutamine-hydrolyzing) [Pseudoalteromonas sp. APC 3356]|uniref:asparagine synthase (glutamine-hydrolyzing) n=1 Tax=unclassified Pseudoalteromonas TaxID=194690 RepID=UPI000318F163|nr:MULTISPECIES: asparagine synthase (glutamine-hydrolyzing) [unclassified Pseudoalteromonas]MDN3434317.1 asparagine synthase (glutamine-hydrolyzing) [Pseudoalteromonas sp. APC 3356]